MNKKKLYLLKIRSFLLKKHLWLLGMIGLGFLSSCTKFQTPEPYAMYGVLYPEFKYKGLVTDQENHTMIPGIRVSITSGNNDTTSSVTDQTGNYILNRYDSYESQNVDLIFSDVDSTLNGEYKTKTVEVVLSFRDINNLEHIANVELEPKQ